MNLNTSYEPTLNIIINEVYNDILKALIAVVFIVIVAYFPGVVAGNEGDIPSSFPAQEKFREHGNVNIGTETETVDPYTGSLKLVYSEVFIPGNGGLDIKVTRTYDTGTMGYGARGGVAPSKYMLSYRWVGLGLGWSLNVAPKVVINNSYASLSGAYDSKVCVSSNTKIPLYTLEHPNGKREALIYVSTNTARTASNWELNCGGSSGPYTLKNPDGVRYELGLVHYDAGNISIIGGAAVPETVLKATKIIDANENYINISYQFFGSNLYTYNGSKLWASYLPVSLTANDGRNVNFSYDVGVARNLSGEHPPRLLSISSNGKILRTYSYLMGGDYDQLKEVVRPDGSKWQYEYWPESNNVNANKFRIKLVTQPTGGFKQYEYSSSRYRICFPASDPMITQPQKGNIHYHQVAKITPSDGSPTTYTYNRLYGPGRFDTTIINDPYGITEYKHIGIGYFFPNNVPAGTENPGMIACPSSNPVADPWKLGLLVEKSINGVATETYNWLPLLISSNYKQFIHTITYISTFPTNQKNYYVPVLSSVNKIIDGAIHSTNYSNYDGYGNPATKIEAGPNGGNRTTTFTYLNDSAKWIIGKLKNETFAGGSTVRTFDGNGNLLSINRDGVTTSYTYDTQGNIATKTFPRGLVRSYFNYKRGVPQSEVQPEGVTISRVVDDAGNVSSETNGVGDQTWYTYDAMNRVTSITPPIGSATSIVYTPISKTATRSDLIEVTHYDDFNRPISITKGGNTITFIYDEKGRKIFESNPGSINGTSYQYDALDRITRISNSDNTYQIHTYGAATKSITDERGKVTTYIFRSYGDPSDQFLMNVAAPETSASFSMTRNARDFITSVTQGGFTRNYGYNSNYYLTSVTNPETGVTTYGRDAAGNMISSQVGTSGVTTYTYDGRNRLMAINYPAGTPGVTKTYNRVDKLVSVVSSNASRSYSYDSNGNLIVDSVIMDGLSFVTNYTYNSKDQLMSTMYPRSNRVVSYSPDVLGRPKQASGYVTNVTYWPSGQTKQIAYANGTISNYGQNGRLWPAAFDTKKGSAVYLNSSYTYDGVGNLIGIADTADSSYYRALGYDGINRLISAAGPWGSGSITYDGVGNISNQTLGSEILYYSYDGLNRLSAVSGMRSGLYGHDVLGNIISAPGNTYSYDGVPNLRCVNCANSNTKVEYTYDGLNQRATVTKAGVKTYEVYDKHGKLLIEYTPSQSDKLVEYIYLGRKRVAQRVTP